jgi:uncharacterized protein (DUF1919 family)
MKDFVIISNNCWGAEVYIDFKREYNTPFVGLFLAPDDFVKMCNNFDYYLSLDLKFAAHSKYDMYKDGHDKKKYPIGLLDDVEIHFLHYADEQEAKNKWTRRLARMNSDKSLWRVKGCDREVSDMHEYSLSWNTIPYAKVFFSAKNLNKLIDGNVQISEFNDKEEVIDGKALYNVSKKYFLIESWLERGEIKQSVINKIYSSLRKI